MSLQLQQRRAGPRLSVKREYGGRYRGMEALWGQVDLAVEPALLVRCTDRVPLTAFNDETTKALADPTRRRSRTTRKSSGR